MRIVRIRKRDVSQEELDALIGVRNQVRRLRKMETRMADDIATRLVDGATVEPGTHIAELDGRRRLRVT